MNEAMLISSPVCFVDQGSLLYMHYAEVVDVNPERQLLLVRQKTWINIAKPLHQDSVEAKQVTSESSFTLITVLQQKKGVIAHLKFLMSTRHDDMRLTSNELFVNSTNLLWHPISFSAPSPPCGILRFLRVLMAAPVIADDLGTRLLGPMQEMLSFDVLLISSSAASVVLFSLWKMFTVSLISSSESLFGPLKQIFLSGSFKFSNEWLLLRICSTSSPTQQKKNHESKCFLSFSDR